MKNYKCTRIYRPCSQKSKSLSRTTTLYCTCFTIVQWKFCCFHLPVFSIVLCYSRKTKRCSWLLRAFPLFFFLLILYSAYLVFCLLDQIVSRTKCKQIIAWGRVQFFFIWPKIHCALTWAEKNPTYCPCKTSNEDIRSFHQLSSPIFSHKFEFEQLKNQTNFLLVQNMLFVSVCQLKNRS